ncbi:MAG: hypothetical protein EOP48_18245 [Sphingobacteriales bacterium]|nr:MAG: hypothetical protein EOP48_18245 [Sphingobacteriales bacterium]
MNYHEPDSRWAGFDIHDYNSYFRTYLVKGLFHSVVPHEVKEAYSMAEYMMAFAWYHYPLYDEAFFKVLRIIEMAVKLRCQQIDIQLRNTRLRNNKTVEETKMLQQLANELRKAEPDKDLRILTEIIPKLRNSIMHPVRHSFAGSSSYGAVKRCDTN